MVSFRVILNPQGVFVGRHIYNAATADAALFAYYREMFEALGRGDPVYFHVTFQAPITNPNDVFFGGELGCRAILNPGQTIAPSQEKINIQDILVRGPVGTEIIVILA